MELEDVEVSRREHQSGRGSATEPAERRRRPAN
jgi:hypothetical protein